MLSPDRLQLACIVLAICSQAQTTSGGGKLAKPEALSSEEIDNFFKLTENVYSGSSPEKEQSFAELQKRGIKTIISVDGAQPNVSAAKKFGMRERIDESRALRVFAVNLVVVEN